jgi:hypothetical protein
VLELNKDLIKNATGYDLRQLFIGAEGTLGFVVEATMRLDRAPRNLTAMVLGTPDFDSIMPVLHAFQGKLDLTAFEFFSDKGLAKIMARGDVPAPFATDCPFYALLEFEASTEEVANEALETFEHCVEQGWVLDGVMSQSETQLRTCGSCANTCPKPSPTGRRTRTTFRSPCRKCRRSCAISTPSSANTTRIRSGLVRPHRRRQPAPEHPQA